MIMHIILVSITVIMIVGSVAETVKESSHDLGSTATLVRLLRPYWIRRFSMIISAWWLRTEVVN